MTKKVTKEAVARAVEETLSSIAFNLPDDILFGLKEALRKETNPRGAQALELLIQNASIAKEDRVPICQDTGSVWCCLEIGPDIEVVGDVFSLVDKSVAQVYNQEKLRKSMVSDALFDRRNTKNNTPAFTELHVSERPGARLHLMAKGGGSDNASRVVMLAPGAGRAGVIQCVLDCVQEKAANACPPLIVGVGIGATFDKVAGLAKSALMRPLNEAAPDRQIQLFEEELLNAINSTGIGAAALGGDTTALGVRVKTASCHIAALPVAINMGCSALRRATIELA